MGSTQDVKVISTQQNADGDEYLNTTKKTPSPYTNVPPSAILQKTRNHWLSELDDNCDNVQGFAIIHSIKGGTGSSWSG